MKLILVLLSFILLTLGMGNRAFALPKNDYQGTYGGGKVDISRLGMREHDLLNAKLVEVWEKAELGDAALAREDYPEAVKHYREATQYLRDADSYIQEVLEGYGKYYTEKCDSDYNKNKMECDHLDLVIEQLRVTERKVQVMLKQSVQLEGFCVQKSYSM